MEENEQKEVKSFWGSATGILLIAILAHFSLCILIILFKRFIPCLVSEILFNIMYELYVWVTVILFIAFVFVSRRRVDEVKRAFKDSPEKRELIKRNKEKQNKKE